MNQPYFQLKDVFSQISTLRDVGIPKGESCGLVALDEFFTLKKGFPLFIAGAPYSGKTEFVLEILLNTSILYGWKHFIYVGEGGDVENVFGELIHKHAQKSFSKKSAHYIDEKEFISSTMFIQKYFVVANHDKEFTVGEFYANVLEAETELNIKFDTTLFDPFNDIKEDIEGFGGREDKYLASALKTVRVDAKKNNRINILVNHIADVRAVVDQATGKRYMPPALPNEWAGGRTWWRRAFTMILVYRPPSWMKDANGMEYAENESHICIQKSKPKGIGRNGQASIFFDWIKNRYWCYGPNGQKLYSCETLEKLKEEDSFRLMANETFLNDKEFNDDHPF